MDSLRFSLLSFVFMLCINCAIMRAFSSKDKNSVNALLAEMGYDIRPQTLGDWQEVFGRVAEKYFNIISHKEEITLELEFSEFLQYVRLRAEETVNAFVNHEGVNVQNDQTYKSQIQKVFPKETDPPELGGGIHFRKWILLLHLGDEEVSPSLHKLRRLLHENRVKYRKYAMGMERIYGIFSIPHHSNILKPRYFNASDPQKYLKLLNPECKFAVSNFLMSESETEEETKKQEEKKKEEKKEKKENRLDKYSTPPSFNDSYVSEDCSSEYSYKSSEYKSEYDSEESY
ncbi:uncharacterized protein LOC135847424 [Planococcus citri]|uniref:uncharacterized protein LOC135847424 n=1 Tax=Planococcus citri TaxID=170843 RepID=UPI0031F809F1